MRDGPDIVIIGSGIGGGTMAAALAASGRRIVILERGERLADCPEARDDRAIFERGHFRPDERWHTPEGEAFNPGNYYYVGGNSKLYGAVLIRYRAEDFRPVRQLGGTTPGWPISYDEIEPWYQAAEELYGVHGDAEQDPTEPRHSGSYPFLPVPDEPGIAAVRARLTAAGVTPSSLPLGIDLDAWLTRAATPWDAFPDTTGAKRDGETVGIAKALKHPNVTLQTGALVTGLRADAKGRIVAVEYSKDGPLSRGAPHPRAYGTFPRVLAKYVRDEGVLTLPEAIRRMTSAAAAQFQVADRGVVRPGLFADLVVFDPATVADTATYDRPHQYPVGLPHVIVNGVPAVLDGKVTDARPGRVLAGSGGRATIADRTKR